MRSSVCRLAGSNSAEEGANSILFSAAAPWTSWTHSPGVGSVGLGVELLGIGHVDVEAGAAAELLGEEPGDLAPRLGAAGLAADGDVVGGHDDAAVGEVAQRVEPGEDARRP